MSNYYDFRTDSKGNTLPKGELCKICNKKLAREKHHLDYTKPQLIEFLCRVCHLWVHGGEENR